MKKLGIDSKILCWNKKLQSSESVIIPRSRTMTKFESLISKFTSEIGLNDVHRLSTFNIKKSKLYLETDIFDFHCLHGGFFNYLALPSLITHKPAVFTLHDMWPYTGHCAFSYDCNRWQTGCGKCPYPESPPAIRRDNTRLEWRLKNWVYNRSNLTIVTPSTWLTEQVNQSMLNRFPVHHIPYGVDTEIFQPLDPEQCRSVLGIPSRQKVLLFAAAKLNDKRKGFDLLIKALHSLPQSLKSEILLLTFGSGEELFAETTGLRTLSLGYINSNRLKSICYSAADMFLLPTRADNFPLVALESMACGTPIISFRVGGVPDQVRPGRTGYLAEPENTLDFCEGILQLLEDEHLRNDDMGQQCRDIALKEYTLELQVQRYLALYSQLLPNGTTW
jgi:glycosyltransferase involved in cell wall biosynthesis